MEECTAYFDWAVSYASKVFMKLTTGGDKVKKDLKITNVKCL
jgi:hypothetical protein